MNRSINGVAAFSAEESKIKRVMKKIHAYGKVEVKKRD